MFELVKVLCHNWYVFVPYEVGPLPDSLPEEIILGNICRLNSFFRGLFCLILITSLEHGEGSDLSLGLNFNQRECWIELDI